MKSVKEEIEEIHFHEKIKQRLVDMTNDKVWYDIWNTLTYPDFDDCYIDTIVTHIKNELGPV